LTTEVQKGTKERKMKRPEKPMRANSMGIH